MPRKAGCRSTRPFMSGPRDPPEFHTILAVSSLVHRVKPPPHTRSCKNTRSRGNPGDGVGGRHQLALPIGAALHLDLAFGEAARTHQYLPGNADAVGGGKL